MGEEQRGPARGDHPAVDLGGLEARVHGGLDHGQVAVAPELIEVRAQVGEAGGGQDRRILPEPPRRRNRRC
jgi:hypothetical protein